MFGNLSKVLIRSPKAFSNKLTKFKIFSGFPNFNCSLSPNIRRTKRNFPLKQGYFREKDFLTLNYESELNYNHNRRHIPYLNDTSLPCLSTKSKNNNIETMNKYNTISRDKNRGIELSNEALKSISNTYHKHSMSMGLHTNEPITKKIGYNDYIGRNNMFKKIYLKKTNYKSLEELFQDSVDEKFKSLKAVRPHIKEQLAGKYRRFVGYRDYVKYKNPLKMMYHNPFYISLKMKELITSVNN